MPLSRHRRGRKTETSSDASQEAPERARKDTPKEARLRLARMCLSRASLQAKFSGFLATLPMAAAAVSSKPLYRAGNLFRRGELRLRPSRVGMCIIPKNQACGRKIRTRKLGCKYSTRRPVRALSTGNSSYACLHASNDINSDSFSPFLFPGGTPAYKKESHLRQTFDSRNAKFLSGRLRRCEGVKV